MAITLGSIQEEILTRQQRAIVKSVYRASQMLDAVSQLDKMILNLTTGEQPLGPATEASQHIFAMRRYLQSEIQIALQNTKLPISLKTVKSDTPTE